ncbi:MAG: Uma2 family endonuclease, partial [Gemmatimonadaceae bacterium]
MATETKQWTLAELRSLPDDGNRYELVRGALFVTPAPSNPHERIAARLTRILDPYAAKHGLGDVYRPRSPAPSRPGFARRWRILQLYCCTAHG